MCITAIRQLKLQPTTAEASFLYKGCQNWKDACVVFPRHEESLFHKCAVQAVINLPATTRDVADSLSWQAAETKKGNRSCLLQVMISLRFIAGQGPTIRADMAMVKATEISVSY